MYDKKELERVLRECGSKSAAAKQLGIPRTTFRRRLGGEKWLERERATITRRIRPPTKSASIELFLDPDEYRVLTLDIETSGLKGDFDIVLCTVLHHWGTREKSMIFELDLNDKLLYSEAYMLEDINDTIKDYEGIISYYGSKFDVPFLRTRMYYHNQQPFGKMKHLDIYFTVKRVLATASKRMDRVNELLRIGNPTKSPTKTKLDIEEWLKVVYDKDMGSLGYIVEHCEIDVEITENIVNEFRKFLPDRVLRS